MLSAKQKTFNNFFDNGPDEPELCKFRGFEDCENCYFRLSTLKRITWNVKQLHRGPI